MVSILLRKTGIPKGFSPEEFEREFPLICQSHRDKGRALAFAFILYDFADAQVIKVLDDSVYWDALDRISGSYLTIFSFHITPLGKLGMGLKKRRKVTKQNHLFSYSNSFIEKQFGIELPASQPLLLFFQAGDGKLSTPYLYKLTADSIEAAFNELKGAILAAVQSVKEVLPENSGKSDEIFSLIKKELGQRKLLKRVAKVARVVKNVVPFIPK